MCEWLIEFSHEPENLDEFTMALDEELKKVNSDYEAKRFKDITLNKPIVHKMPVNTFYKWLEKNKNSDRISGSDKSNDRQ